MHGRMKAMPCAVHCPQGQRHYVSTQQGQIQFLMRGQGKQSRSHWVPIRRIIRRTLAPTLEVHEEDKNKRKPAGTSPLDLAKSTVAMSLRLGGGAPAHRGSK